MNVVVPNGIKDILSVLRHQMHQLYCGEITTTTNNNHGGKLCPMEKTIVVSQRNRPWKLQEAVTREFDLQVKARPAVRKSFRGR
jgi:hypothetical protein